MPATPPSEPDWRPFRVAHFPVRIESSRSARNTALSEKSPYLLSQPFLLSRRVQQTSSSMKGSVGAERITRDMAKPLNHDSPWKVTVEKLTRSFLEVTFPEVAAGIDWSVKPKSLEQELHQITPASEIGCTTTIIFPSDDD